MHESQRSSRFAQRLTSDEALELVGPVLSEKTAGVDVVLAPPIGNSPWPGVDDDPNPFIRYRKLLWSYELARNFGFSDKHFCAMVAELDAAVAEVDGRGFEITPLMSCAALSEAVGIGEILIKDETNNVSGSHKGRHLFGIALHLKILQNAGKLDTGSLELAIASCGNAALAAAVIARATGFNLRVFVPNNAAQSVLDRLILLGAELIVCERQNAEQGDPAYLRFLEAVDGGNVAFCCQGPDNGLTLDGGRTIGFELADQLLNLKVDRLFVQVGGGALATGLADGLAAAAAAGVIASEPRLHPVQTQGAYPLSKAYRSIFGEIDNDFGADKLQSSQHDSQSMISDAAQNRSAHMVPWPTEPNSAAHGILDDETYDWQSVLRATVATGGWPIIASEQEILEANELGRLSGIDADHTGTAGFAGLLHLVAKGIISAQDRSVVLFTGARR